jgi:hypothetical protein
MRPHVAGLGALAAPHLLRRPACALDRGPQSRPVSPRRPGPDPCRGVRGCLPDDGRRLPRGARAWAGGPGDAARGGHPVLLVGWFFYDVSAKSGLSTAAPALGRHRVLVPLGVLATVAAVAWLAGAVPHLPGRRPGLRAAAGGGLDPRHPASGRHPVGGGSTSRVAWLVRSRVRYGTSASQPNLQPRGIT